MDGDVDFDSTAFYNLIGCGLRLQTAKRDYPTSDAQCSIRHGPKHEGHGIPCPFDVESHTAADCESAAYSTHSHHVGSELGMEALLTFCKRGRVYPPLQSAD